MNGRFFLRVVFAIILIALLAGAGVFIYNMGVTQGLAASGKLAAPNLAAPGTGAAPYYYAPFYRPWGFGFGFFPFGFIFPLLFFFLIIFAIRGLFFRGPRWGHMGYGGWRGGPGGFDPNHVPPMVEEWHRKMHEGSTETPNEGQER